MKKTLFITFCLAIVISCSSKNTATTNKKENVAPFDWSAASVYFLLTDRFYNGDKTNDSVVKRNEKTATLRGFEGGDFAGIQRKIQQGYFTDLGINAIWLTPIFEQIKGGVDEGTGFTYAYHGYWAKDWTAVEPAFGTMEEFKELVTVAHKNDIRILLDVVLNHTGPVTGQDPQWPDSWVRTGPTCTYQDQETAVSCTLTDNLPDIRTDSREEVELPEILVQKWKSEGRYEQEKKELDNFFSKTDLPRTPANYLIKWVTDYARETGVDGFRVDTVKHVEESIWATFNEQAKRAYEEWKQNNPDQMIHDDEFFILGELYGYYAQYGPGYRFNDGVVDYFDAGYNAMINFGFKDAAREDFGVLFQKYATMTDSLYRNTNSAPAYFMNYISSHDDGQPLDPMRENAIDTGSKLLLAPGMAQIYYGDESARKLTADGASGDANLRTMMNWENLDSNVLSHWQILGRFRKKHLAVGAGRVEALDIDGAGSLTARLYEKSGYFDKVIIGAGLQDGKQSINVSSIFSGNKKLRNAYMDEVLTVENGQVTATVKNGLVLLESIE